MGVSFKISKKGKRYTPQGGLSDENETQNDTPTISNQPQVEEMKARQGGQAAVGDTGAPSFDFAKSGSLLNSKEPEVSFSVNLFPNGFNVGKQNEIFQDVPKDLLPYDRQAESIFSAIEHGCIPGDLFDDIPCKYVNGTIACEVRDYRTSFKEGENPSSPKIEKVVLRMGMEQVIKEIALVADDSWTYSNILEMEARVLKAMRPVLNLNPKPMLDGFQESHPTKKLNFGISQERKKRRLNEEFSQQQPFESLAATSISSEVHQEENHLDQCIEGECVHGSTDSQMLQLPLPSTTSTQQALSEVDPRPNAGLTALKVKQERVEFSNIPSFEGGNRKDAENISEPPPQPPRPIPSRRAKALSTQGQSKKSGQSRQKNRNENNTHGHESLATSQAAAGLSKDLGKESSTPARGKAKSSVNNSSKKKVASFPNTTSPEVGTDIVGSHANSSHESGALAVANVLETSVPYSSPAIDPLLGRLLSIKNVSESYGLHTRKHKDFWTNDKGLVYGPTTMIAFHLENAEDDRGSSHYAAGPSHSSYAGVSKITTLTFVSLSWAVSQGRLIKLEAKRRLILRERPDEGHTEAITLFERDGSGLIQTFHNNEFAKQFAFQFISLMAREGYNLVDEQVESVPIHYRSTTISQQPAFPNNAIPAAFELPPLSPSITELYPRPPTATNSPSTSNLSRGHDNVQSVRQHQLDPISQQWQQQQHFINSARIRHQLAQRKIAMEGSGLSGSPVGPAQGASVGTTQIRPGTAGLVSQQNMGPPSQMGSNQQLSNAPLLRHASPQLESRIQRSDNRSSPNSSARSVVELWGPD